jgi:UDP-N-acetylmuramate--alanine ligase
LYKKIQKIHFVGIGGIGMSGIAEVLINLGYKVTGSDMKESDTTKRLASLGAVVHYGHTAKNLDASDVVVISSAVKQDNPEVVAAHERVIPVIPRAEMLAELMRLKYGIAVAGSHGKTTTTSMVATVLAHGGMDPTMVVGGKLNSLGTNAKLGQGEFMVAEADESDGSFLRLSQTISVITNIDPEHLDYYVTMERLMDAFHQFANKIPFYGLSVLCLDHPNVQALIPDMKKRYATYGMTAQADFQAREIGYEGLRTHYTAFYKRKRLGKVTLRMPGLHNVYNSLAALAVGTELDLPFSTIKEGLASFSGVQRRFQIKGEVAGVTVVDDYGHHPEEIKATLSAARNAWDRRVIAVFQPHRYTRTRDLFNDFLKAFYQADTVVLTEIYAAGEDPIEGIRAERLYEGVKEHGHRDVRFVPEKERLASELMDMVREGDLVVTLGAGDVWKVGEELLDRLKVKGER